MSKSFPVIVLVFLFVAPLVTSSIAVTQATPSMDYVPAESEFFVRGPTVNLVTNNSAMIFWRTANPSDSLVEYGLNTSLLESETNVSAVTDHYIDLTGLEMDTKYYYRVQSGVNQSEIYHFLTAPADGNDFKMIVAGDNRPGSDEAPVQPSQFSTIADLIIAEEPHIVFLTGDFVHSIGDLHSENLYAWSLFNEISDRIGHYAPVIGIIGNHDTGAWSGSVQSQYYLDAFVNVGTEATYFSFDYAGTHLTILDSEEYDYPGRITATQYDWLVDDLSNSTASNKFVFAHRPLYPVNHINSALDVNLAERDRLQELFEDQNVTAFLSGHDHCYMRLVVNDVLHIVTGGLGAPLYESPWSHSEYHYVRMNVSDVSVNFEEIIIDSTIGDTWDMPYDGPILIQLRHMRENVEHRNDSIPEVYFSSKPATEYYSWDSGTNSSELTDIPDAPGAHSLDIYAEDDEGTWSHESYTFVTRDDSETTPTTTTDTNTTSTADFVLDPIIIVGIVGAVAIVIVVIILMKRK